MARRKGKMTSHKLRMGDTTSEWRQNFIVETVKEEGANFPIKYTKQLVSISRSKGMNIGYVDSTYIHAIRNSEAKFLDDVVPFKYMQEGGYDEYNRIYYTDLTNWGRAIFDDVLSTFDLTQEDREWAREHYLVGWICADELEEFVGSLIDTHPDVMAKFNK